MIFLFVSFGLMLLYMVTGEKVFVMTASVSVILTLIYGFVSIGGIT
ncbi:MAG: hypothetical protein M1542_07645 [Thermotogae bacterium]|jgi:hypothetical protein|nr:hypothetical protein [Thermotogota bacterium]MCL5033098.1 hypothetical protein [Thermotogota bacterium]